MSCIGLRLASQSAHCEFASNKLHSNYANNLARIVVCILFCSVEVSDRPFHLSSVGCYRQRQGQSFGLTPSPSELSCVVSSSSEEKNQHANLTLSRQLSERAFWLQRQNSLSSRNAIYPPCLRYSSSPGSLRSVSAPQVGMHRHWPYSPSHRSFTSTSTTASPLPSVLESSDSSCYPTRPSSSVSSTSSSPLSTMRRASQPEVPIIPNRFLSVSSSGQQLSQRRSSRPLVWSPFLRHVPLSEDPEIRALSLDLNGEEAGSSPPESVRSECLALPRRARGHTIPGRR